VPSRFRRTFLPGVSDSECIEILLSIWLGDLKRTEAVATIPPRKHCRPISSTHKWIDARKAIPFQNGGLRFPIGQFLAEATSDFFFTREEPGVAGICITRGHCLAAQTMGINQ
jgi:hypothetical protein